MCEVMALKSTAETGRVLAVIAERKRIAYPKELTVPEYVPERRPEREPVYASR